jgi:hypothetical protein
MIIRQRADDLCAGPAALVQLVIAFAARNSAAYFTTWYPQYRKAKYGAPPANALPGTN